MERGRAIRLRRIHIGFLLNQCTDSSFVTPRCRVSNIGAILDPNLRTAKVRVELPNPGLLRVGMFATATFHAQKQITRVVVPASAVLHLRDRDWVYVSKGGDAVERRMVVAVQMLPDKMQEIISGLEAGQRVIADALVLQTTIEQ